MADPSRKPKPGPLMWQLVFADLRHEWLLSLCMVLAIASIMTPLLLLFGLKYGTIETFRHRLLENPRNREIRPLTSQPYEQAWFDEVENWPEVSFVIPYTRQMSANLDAYPITSSTPFSLDIIPSSPGDPWLASANIQSPQDGQAVLSASAAETLGVMPDAKLKVAAKRLQGSQIERGDAELEITAVFADGGPENKAIFTSLSFLEKVEAYKDGRGVPELGWKGDLPAARPVFTAALIGSPEKLSPTSEFKSINNTGFVAIYPITFERASSLTGRTEMPKREYYFLETKGTPVRTDNLLALANIFRGTGTEIYPLVQSLSVSIICDGAPKRFNLVPDLPATTAGSLENYLSPDLSTDRRLKLKMSAGQCSPGETLVTFAGNAGGLKFPVMIEDGPVDLAADYAAAPLILLGSLGQADLRALTYDPGSGLFLLGRRAYAGFRLYAKTLEDVAPLQKKFESMGIKVAAESGRIEEMQKLDSYLTLIFWLITTATVIGAGASLLSNIYAGLERKRRELGVLRLLGVSGLKFIKFPLYSSVLLATGGFISSWLMFSSLSAVINHLFRSHLRAGESLCRLNVDHALTALGLSLAIAALAGIVAALRAVQIEPAEALRDE